MVCCLALGGCARSMDERANGGNNKSKQIQQAVLPKRHDNIVFICLLTKSKDNGEVSVVSSNV